MTRHFRVYEQSYPHFITSTVVDWIPVLCKEGYTRVLVDSFNYCIEHKGLLVHGYVIMPNHFHAIVTSPGGHLTDVIRDLKGFTAAKLLKALEGAGRPEWLKSFRIAGDHGGRQLWQPGIHPEQIHSEAFFKQKLDYIHMNPVRAGFISNPCAWTHSSAGFYYDESASSIAVAVLDW